ncbi:hypothetical protein D3C75_758390 [compost metagenome]
MIRRAAPYSPMKSPTAAGSSTCTAQAACWPRLRSRHLRKVTRRPANMRSKATAGPMGFRCAFSWQRMPTICCWPAAMSASATPPSALCASCQRRRCWVKRRVRPPLWRCGGTGRRVAWRKRISAKCSRFCSARAASCRTAATRTPAMWPARHGRGPAAPPACMA